VRWCWFGGGSGDGTRSKSRGFQSIKLSMYESSDELHVQHCRHNEKDDASTFKQGRVEIGDVSLVLMSMIPTNQNCTGDSSRTFNANMTSLIIPTR
jgi:hypothetical protein